MKKPTICFEKHCELTSKKVGKKLKLVNEFVSTQNNFNGEKDIVNNISKQAQSIQQICTNLLCIRGLKSCRGHT